MNARQVHEIWLMRAEYAAHLDFCCCYHSGEDDAFHFFQIQPAQ